MKSAFNGKRVALPMTAPMLTVRQRQILLLIAEGFTCREIGQQLKISIQTVEVHRYHLMQRLDARNVAQLIRQALLFKYLPTSYPHKT